MSEDYEKFYEIPPFKVKADPSILINDKYYPWLRRNKQMTQAKKKWRLSPATIMMIPCQLCNRWVWYHSPFCTCTCYANFFRVHFKCFNVLWLGPRNTINPVSLLVNNVLTKNTLKRAATWAIGKVNHKLVIHTNFKEFKF